MLRSPYSQVRARGAIGLRALGETVADPVPSPPVAFRVIVDGRPWASPVEWELEGSQRFESGTGSPDRDGVVRLDRDPFLDPTAPVESIRLSASDFEERGGTWFTFLVKPPSDLDVRTLLDVRTGSLTVVVPSLVAAAPGQGTAILMVTAPQPDGDEETILTIPDAHAGRYHFEHLQHGTYVARVLLGGAVLASPEVEVGTRPQTVELTPEPGPDPAVEDDSTGEHDTPRP
jgi:hypothetical protein